MTSESEWLRSLRDAPRWMLQGAELPMRVVVLSPHPDDEILGAGGFLAAQVCSGVPITIIAATDGEGAYDDVPELATIRQREQEAALSKVGIFSKDVQRLKLPDSGLKWHEGTIASHLVGVLDAETLLLAPWEHDPHPDHETCGRAATTAAAATGAQHVSYFFWTWHHCGPQALRALQLVRFDLDDEYRAAKIQALAEYHSQLQHPSGSPILPESLLAPALRPFETFSIHDSRS